MAKPSLVLATDLDGTFLGGDNAKRTKFYTLLEQHRNEVLLIFVTGRSLDLVNNIYTEDSGVPVPDFIISDVGTTVFHGATSEPLAPIQDWIAGQWQNSNNAVKQLLADERGLTLQPIDPDYRVSYFCTPEGLEPSTLQKLTDAGFDYIYSDNNFLDVLPRGVAKGTTLLKLLDFLSLDSAQVVTCGDTLNDLSLFQTGLKGIAVGNSEDRLVAEIQTMPNVYHSQGTGAMGIWEGLEHYRYGPFA